jgi:hypothetical protein
VDRSTAKQPDALGAALGTPGSSWGTIAFFVVLIGGTLFAVAAARHGRPGAPSPANRT